MVTKIQQTIAVWYLLALSTFAFPWNVPGLHLLQREAQDDNARGGARTVTVTVRATATIAKTTVVSTSTVARTTATLKADTVTRTLAGNTVTRPAVTSIVTITASAPSASTASPSLVPLYGQCGGFNYEGPTECGRNAVCEYDNDFYSQCVIAPRDGAVAPSTITRTLAVTLPHATVTEEGETSTETITLPRATVTEDGEPSTVVSTSFVTRIVSADGETITLTETLAAETLTVPADVEEASTTTVRLTTTERVTPAILPGPTLTEATTVYITREPVGNPYILTITAAVATTTITEDSEGLPASTATITQVRTTTITETIFADSSVATEEDEATPVPLPSPIGEPEFPGDDGTLTLTDDSAPIVTDAPVVTEPVEDDGGVNGTVSILPVDDITTDNDLGSDVAEPTSTPVGDGTMSILPVGDLTTAIDLGTDVPEQTLVPEVEESDAAAPEATSAPLTPIDVESPETSADDVDETEVVDSDTGADEEDATAPAVVTDEENEEPTGTSGAALTQVVVPIPASATAEAGVGVGVGAGVEVS